jgi:hypothetical protein
MARTRELVFPFTSGQREDFDPKMLDAGLLTLAKNMRLRRDGRFGVRYGYTALDQVSNPLLSGATESSFRAQQVLNLDERLVAIGGTGVTAPSNPYVLVQTPTFTWERIDGGSGVDNIGPITSLTSMGQMPSPGVSITRMDVAAGNGLVCMVFESATDTSTAHIFRASDNTSLLANPAFTGTRPRVVCINNVFFVGYVVDSDGHIGLFKYDPATNANLFFVTSPLAAGAAITSWDMMPDPITGGFIIVAHRASTPATSLLLLSSAGAVTQTITGPATAFNHVTCLATVTGTDKYHIAAVTTAAKTVSLYSYLIAGSLSPASPTTGIGTAATTDRQVGLIENGSSINLYISENSTPPKVQVVGLLTSSHASGSGSTSYFSTTLQAKPFGASSFQGFGALISDGSFNTNFIALTRSTEMLVAEADHFEAVSSADNHLPSISQDSTSLLYYWSRLKLDVQDRGNAVIGEFAYLLGGARRSGTALGGMGYLSGGQVQVYDTRELFDAGFQMVPVIYSATPSNSTGALPSSTTITVAVVWEWFDALGNKHLSDVSEETVVTMGAADDTITLSISTPKTLKDGNSSALGGPVTVAVYRTLDGSDTLRRAASTDAPTGTNYSTPVTVILTGTDNSISTNEVIYTQDGRAGLGVLLPHEAPLPCKHMTRFGTRILTAGLPDPTQVQVSKELFPGEPVEWSGDLAYLFSFPFTVQGIITMDLRAFVFGRNQIFQMTGPGPDASGDGTYDIVQLPSVTGLYSSLSLVETPLGVMFQGDADKIYLLPRDGGAPVWFGQPIRTTLEAFPVITSASLNREEQLVSFTCNNTGSTDSRVIHYDLRANTWVVDSFNSSTVIRSATNYQGRLAWVNAADGVVSLSKSTHPDTAFITHALRTATIRPFQGSWGKLTTITFLGEWRGVCKLTCLISYDDGVSFTTLHTFDLTTGFTAGDTVRKQWYPRRRKGDRFMLEFQALVNDAATASEGLVFNEYVISVIGETGRARLHPTTATKATDRG